jgi:hypothetical protein
MHRTPSVDLICVLSGEIWLELEAQEVTFARATVSFRTALDTLGGTRATALARWLLCWSGRAQADPPTNTRERFELVRGRT